MIVDSETIARVGRELANMRAETCKWELVRDKLLPPSHHARERREYKVNCSAAGYVLFDLHIGHWNYCPLCGKKIEVQE